MSIKTFKITTAVTIQVKLDRDNPDSVTIEIEDPSDIVKVNYLAMTKLADNIYQYIWQSVETDQDGQYQITIKAKYGNYTSTEQDWFELVKIDD